MKRFSLVFALMALAALTACGGGGVHSSGTVPAAGGASGLGLLLTGPHNTAPAAGAVHANVSVFVPFARQTAATRRRRPNYITSYTAGIELEAVQNGQTSGFQFSTLSANAPGCSIAENDAGFTCALTLAAPVGQTEILVGTFDSGAQGSGNLLSVADQIVTIQPGIANNIPITTQPIAANIQPVTQPPSCVVVGTPVNITTNYTAYDADGGDLTGMTLGNTISVANVNPADTSSGYSLSPSSFTSGSGTITFTYNGTDTNVGIFNITSSLAPDGGTNEYVGILGTVPAATAGPHMVYVSDSGNNEILGYDICTRSADPSIYTLPTGFNPVEVKFDRSSTAGDPRLFVLSQALNELLWLDVQSVPGAVKGTALTFGGTPHHVNNSSTSAFLWVTIGAGTFKKFAINEGTPALTASGPTISTLNAPRGFGLGGAGSDILVANTGVGTIQAVNPSSMVTDGAVTITGSPSAVSGPNSNASCALATSSSPANSAFAVSIVGAGGTPVQIGSQLSLGGPPVAQQFFPPATGSGTIGFGTNTGIIATTGAGAQIVTCDGSTFSPVEIWTTFMAQPAAMVSSQYSSLAVGGVIYVTGFDQNIPVIQPFVASYDHDLGAIQLPNGSNPTDITAGP